MMSKFSTRKFVMALACIIPLSLPLGSQAFAAHDSKGKEVTSSLHITVKRNGDYNGPHKGWGKSQTPYGQKQNGYGHWNGQRQYGLPLYRIWQPVKFSHPDYRNWSCYNVKRTDYRRGRPALIGAQMCHDLRGRPYIVPGSVKVISFAQPHWQYH